MSCVRVSMDHLYTTVVAFVLVLERVNTVQRHICIFINGIYLWPFEEQTPRKKCVVVAALYIQVM